MKAAIFRRAHEPLQIESVTVDKPRDREVLVRTAATGVCHSDLHYVDGDLPPRDHPMVMGHEGSGVVEAVGSAVTTVKPGDHVVACLSGFCGACPQCLSGHPNVCATGYVSRASATTPRLSLDGEPLIPFANVGSYAEQMLLHENSLVKIDRDIPLDRAALVGCGVLTGVGAALRTSGLQAGQTVAVFGCGGVGLSIIQGARIGGASRIIGIDKFPAKLERAHSLGATDVIDSSKGDTVAQLRELTGGQGVDHAFRGCRAIRPECKVQTSRMGSNQFRTDIPRYLEFYRQGRLNLDDMVSKRGRLEDINEAFRAMKAGEVARSVLTFDGAC
ncbi:Alcohol dehydrogenase 1A [Geodia barretti]|uniref:Alcohol dehydrogenase 1A n=1 Tax=Geodia barretti TaxID=519541 RepID=A0AA35SM89_GEOBA|nr:Alcohol dehydrogenase 1A [Geodia barretti]